MLIFDPEELKVPEVHRLLLGGVAPRPIALVSTISSDGIRNLSPFSFYNVFGANPPYIAFSPARRGRDGSFKDTYNNLMDNGECVVNAVTFEITEQISYASTEFPSGVDEFAEAGLTPLSSTKITPARVAESPFQMECKLDKMINLGDGKASGNLAICRVLLIHASEKIFENGIISPYKIDLISRMSGNYYCRANGEAIFKVPKPDGMKGIGYRRLPEEWKRSDNLSANEIGKLCNLQALPTIEELEKFYSEHQNKVGERLTLERIKKYLSENNVDLVIPHILNLGENKKELLILAAKKQLENNELNPAAILLTIAHY